MLEFASHYQQEAAGGSRRQQEAAPTSHLNSTRAFRWSLSQNAVSSGVWRAYGLIRSWVLAISDAQSQAAAAASVSAIKEQQRRRSSEKEGSRRLLRSRSRSLLFVAAACRHLLSLAIVEAIPSIPLVCGQASVAFSRCAP